VSFVLTTATKPRRTFGRASQYDVVARRPTRDRLFVSRSPDRTVRYEKFERVSGHRIETRGVSKSPADGTRRTFIQTVSSAVRYVINTRLSRKRTRVYTTSGLNDNLRV